MAFNSPYPQLEDAGNPFSLRQHASSSSSPEADGNGTKLPHKRSYQACEACRKRKVKCDFGDPDNPHRGQCARCRREMKECVIASSRRKRRVSTESTTLDEHRVKRRMTSTAIDSHLTTPPILQRSPPASLNPPAWNGNHNRNSNGHIPPPLPHPPVSHTPRTTIDHPNPNSKSKHVGPQLIKNDLTATMFQQHNASTLDNINNLAQAAAYVEKTDSTKSPTGAHATPVRRGRGLSNLGKGNSSLTSHLLLRPGAQVALQAWSRMRMVQAGWFTPKEAMEYVEYFYDRLAPMTPVVTPDFRDPVKHSTLLAEEPVLALTILTIASRHLRPEGRGAMTRGYIIHEKLWTYLRKMVERLLWGQEQFGGGFCGAGTTQIRESTGGQITWSGSLRTLGTIEALLLLTDWQPRALHFPPGDDDDRLLSAGPEDHKNAPSTAQETGEGQAYDQMPYAEWLEPSWRSDRMSWMLLGLAQALSFELGAFDTNHYECQQTHESHSDCARKQRIRRLVLIYVSQTSGRMGVPSMLAMSEWGRDKKYEDTAVVHCTGDGPSQVDIMQHLWLHIAYIMWQANRDIFPSRKFTKDLVISGRYIKTVDEFIHKLQNWKQDFEKSSDQISSTMRHVLSMEYEYARLYVNSLGLQSVFESMDHYGSRMQKTALKEVAEGNKYYIDEVTSAAHNILTHLMDGLAAEGRLRDAPIRTYLRALSGMMFTMKRFSLGCPEHVVRDSLTLLTRTTDALTLEVVDDIHLSQQTARLVQEILPRVKATFIRIQAPGNDSDSISRGQSRPQTPGASDHLTDPNLAQVAHDQKTRHLAGTASAPHQSHTYGYPTATNDPLASIQARPIGDFNDEFFMPPPFNFDPTDPTVFEGLDSEHMNGDWFAADLAPLFNNSSMNVGLGYGQTINMGPMIGDQDLIEALTQQSNIHPTPMQAQTYMQNHTGQEFSNNYQ